MGFRARCWITIIGISSVGMLTGCGDITPTSNSSSVSGASSSATTSSNSGQALVALGSSYYATPPASMVQITIQRSGANSGSASVGYSTMNGTASAGVDYAPTSGTVTWSDGDSSAKVISVLVTNSASGKDFSFSLTSVDGQATFGSPAVATVAIAAQLQAQAPTQGSTLSGTAPAMVTSAGSNVMLNWAAPTENTDGSALTNLAGYNIYFGTSSTTMTQKITVASVGMLSYVVSNLSHGTWYFAITSYNSAGVESDPSGAVAASI